LNEEWFWLPLHAYSSPLSWRWHRSMLSKMSPLGSDLARRLRRFTRSR
jgi:hypothetical protein